MGRLVVAVMAAVVLWVWRRSAPAGLPSRERILLLLAAGSLVALEARTTWEFFTTPRVRHWNVFHYYVGSKYFDELGYHDLYEATIKADEVGPQAWNEITVIRDLRTYRAKERVPGQSRYDPEAHFTPERWREFREDIAEFQSRRGSKKWIGILGDRGYNPSPFWTLVGGSLANLLPATNLLALKLLCSLDLLLLAAAFAMLRWAYGVEKASLALLLLVVSPLNYARLVGGFLQYDWFFAVAGAFALYRRGKHRAAGVLFAHAVLTRVFPAVLLLAGAIPVVLVWIRLRRVVWRPWTRFAGACALACCVGVVASGAATGGTEGWAAFTRNLQHHAEHHESGNRRVGLGHVFTYDFSRLDLGEPAPGRPLNAKRHRPIRWALGGGMLVAALLVLRRRNSPDAMVLSLVALFAAAVTSRYYWAYLALLPLLGASFALRRERLNRVLIGILGAYAGLAACLTAGVHHFPSYVTFNTLLCLVLMGLLYSYLRPVRRPAKRQR